MDGGAEKKEHAAVCEGQCSGVARGGPRKTTPVRGFQPKSGRKVLKQECI